MLETFITAVTLAITVSALCSVCEAVLYSLTASQVEMLKKAGSPSATHLQRLRNDIDEPITAILTLNTIANTIGASVAGAAAAKLFGDQYLILFSGVFTLSILIFSEILPKTIGVTFAYKLSPFIAYPLRAMVFVLKPIVLLCRFITRLLPEHKNEDTISGEEIQTIAALSQKSGDIEENEARVISNIIELKNKSVRQIMTPRTVTFALNEKNTVGETMKMIDRLSAHSRIPVYNKSINNITGIVMRRDILKAAAEDHDDITLSNLTKPAYFVPETAQLNSILIDFFNRQQHLFVVVDEYGTMTGIISMEDVIEEIVGQEIMDETDTDSTRDMRELARKRNQERRQMTSTGKSTSES